MEDQLLLVLLIMILLNQDMASGQEGDFHDQINDSICIYNDKNALQEFVDNRNTSDFLYYIEDVTTSTRGLQFDLTAFLNENGESVLVTLVPSSTDNDNAVVALAVQALDAESDSSSNTPIGSWQSMGDVMVKTCGDAPMDNTVYENHFPNVKNKEEYSFQWSPIGATHRTVIFRATTLVFVTQSSSTHPHFFVGIQSNPLIIAATHVSTTMTDDDMSTDSTTRGKPIVPGDGSKLRDIPIFAIIIAAVVFLSVILVAFLSLYCAYEVKKRKKGSVKVDQEAIIANPAQLQMDDTRDEAIEIPETSKKTAGGSKKLSTQVEEEIIESGGSMGHLAGATEIARSHVRMGERIGEGAFADVYKAEAFGITNVEGLTTVAVKVLKDPQLANAEFKKELKVLMGFRPHPNIIQLLGACTEKEPYFLVLEYAEIGDLRSYLHKQRAKLGTKILDAKQLMDFAIQVAAAMEYMEEKQCIHRDLATRNVLLNKDLLCKLTDFGLARSVGQKGEYMMESDAPVPLRWMAPESVLDNINTIKSDVWSFGVLCWELVTMGSYPYGGYKASQVIKKVKNGERLEKPEHCSTELYDVIMTACWQLKPSKRPGFSNLRKQLEVMRANAEKNIVAKQFNVKGYVYLKPNDWDKADDNEDDDDKPLPRKAQLRKKTRLLGRHEKLDFQQSVKQY